MTSRNLHIYILCFYSDADDSEEEEEEEEDEEEDEETGEIAKDLQAETGEVAKDLQAVSLNNWHRFMV